MKFDVFGYGVVGLDNAIWLRCAELDKVKALAVGETAYRVVFGGNGNNRTETDVTRVS